MANTTHDVVAVHLPSSSLLSSQFVCLYFSLDLEALDRPKAQMLEDLIYDLLVLYEGDDPHPALAFCTGKRVHSLSLFTKLHFTPMR